MQSEATQPFLISEDGGRFFFLAEFFKLKLSEYEEYLYALAAAERYWGYFSKYERKDKSN
jgi:hypothetical protein